MKRIFVLSLIAIATMAMQAQTFTYQDVTYTVLDENAQTCEVKSGAIPSSYSGPLDLPSNPKDSDGKTYTLVSIGYTAFLYCRDLTSVTIPNSVTSIGEGAFADCSGLTSVTIPNSVTSIGEGAFLGCGALTSVTIPNSVTSIVNSAFMYCSGLTSVTIPNSVTEIGDYAFYGCSGLTSVEISNSVTSIGQYVFRDCSGLTSVTIPNSVTSIGYHAFWNCSNLTSVYYSATEPISGDRDIFSDYDRPTLYVPAEAVAKCKTISPWQYFSKIEAYDFSGIEPVHSDLDWSKPHEVYDIKGVMVGTSTENLAPGIYIARQDNSVKKIAVK